MLSTLSLSYGFPPESFPVNWSAVPDTPGTRNLDSPFLGFCICDETRGICDPNCCCDVDCSNASKSLFDTCSPEQKSVVNMHFCHENNGLTSLIKVNSGGVSEERRSRSVTCIVRDNYPRNALKYFRIPQPRKPVYSSSYVNKTQFLTLGQYLPLVKYVEVEGEFVFRNFGSLGIPIQNSNGGCIRELKPVEFMSVQNTVSCAANGKQLCDYFPLTRFLNVFVDTNSFFGPLTVNVFDTDGVLIESISPDESTQLTSSVVDGVCKNGVTSVVAMLEYNSTNILEGVFNVTVGDVRLEDFVPFSYEIFFITPGESIPKKIVSGVPGYFIGSRLRGGTLVTVEGKKAIEERKNGFSIPGGGRSCELQNFKTVLFGYPVIGSGCSITLSEEELRELCATGSESFIRNIAAGPDNTLINYVAQTSDALVNDTTSWVEIQGLYADDSPGIYDEVHRQCNNISIGLHYNIETAKAGSTFNPQIIVNGVVAEYIRGSLSIRNYTDYSSGASSTEYIVFKTSYQRCGIQSVLSVKVINPPIVSKVNENFFYPF